MTRQPILFLTAALLVVAASGRDVEAAVELVRDLRTHDGYGLSSGPQQFVAIDGVLYFSAIGATNGRELWKTDGSETGTQLVRDIRLGPEGSEPSGLVAVGETLFFTADDGLRGRELWKSDGTFEGTVPVADPPGLRDSLRPIRLREFRGRLYFVSERRDLWVTDGSDGAAQLVLAGDDHLGFQIIDDGEVAYLTNRRSLHRWDPDGEGNVRLAADLPFIGDATLIEGELYFFGETPIDHHTSTTDLWKSDGTTVGTRVLETEVGGTASWFGMQPARLGDDLVFVVADGSDWSLWKSDRTPGGLVELAEGIGGELFAANGLAWFWKTNVARQHELWVSDGTVDGTRRVADLGVRGPGGGPAGFVAVDGLVFFSAGSPRGLWVSDATEEGTRRYGGVSAPSSVEHLTVTGGRLYFAAGELWTSDGSPEGTRMVVDVAYDPGSSNIGGSRTRSQQHGSVEYGGSLLFGATFGGRNDAGVGLWRSDGTREGTELVVQTPDLNAAPREFGQADGNVYFLANDGSTATELFTSDGTSEGTRRLTDLGPGRAGSVESRPVAIAGHLLFRGFEAGQSGLYRSDPDGEGTALLRTFTRLSSQTLPLRVVNGVALFGGEDVSGAGIQLWRSDGTVAGTGVVEEITAGPWGADPQFAAVLGDALCFSARSDPGPRRRIWCSEGEAEDTGLLIDEDGEHLAVAQDRLSYVVRDYEAGFDRHQIVAYDGEQAVPLLAEPRGFGASTGFVPVGNRVFFTLEDDDVGLELWVSNGTPGGTLLVRDVEPGPGSSLPSELSSVAGQLVFRACSSGFGCELWASDGTHGGTRLVADVAPGQPSSNPRIHGRAGDKLMFSAFTRQIGDEPYFLDIGVCGDGVRGDLEQCDDANTEPGDGCSSTCKLDASWELFGTAEGGSVSVLVEGVELSVETVAGQTGEAVATAIARALAQDDRLAGRGIAAGAVGHRVFTEGEVALFDLADPGLSLDGFCGDGFVDGIAGEACDDGNQAKESCDYGLRSCEVCDAQCEVVDGASSYCGDGILDVSGGEHCDVAPIDGLGVCLAECSAAECDAATTANGLRPESFCSWLLPGETREIEIELAAPQPMSADLLRLVGESAEHLEVEALHLESLEPPGHSAEPGGEERYLHLLRFRIHAGVKLPGGQHVVRLEHTFDDALGEPLPPQLGAPVVFLVPEPDPGPLLGGALLLLAGLCRARRHRRPQREE